MSTSEPNEFNEWISTMVRDHGEFTVLVVLTDLGQGSVTPICSTYFHIIGDEVDWEEISIMFAGCGQPWKGASFFPTKGPNNGPIDNPTARLRLQELEQRVIADRMVLNDGHFFDTSGRRIKIEPEAA